MAQKKSLLGRKSFAQALTENLAAISLGVGIFRSSDLRCLDVCFSAKGSIEFENNSFQSSTNFDAEDSKHHLHMLFGAKNSNSRPAYVCLFLNGKEQTTLNSNGKVAASFLNGFGWATRRLGLEQGSVDFSEKTWKQDFMNAIDSAEFYLVIWKDVQDVYHTSIWSSGFQPQREFLEENSLTEAWKSLGNVVPDSINTTEDISPEMTVEEDNPF